MSWRKMVAIVPRKLTRSFRAAVVTCFTAFFVFLCVLKLEAMIMHDASYHPAHPYMHQPYTKPKMPHYDGPYHRYRLHRGRWTRMTGYSDAVKNYYDGKPPPIPHIIHQTWDTANVPRDFVPWVNSWAQMHPTWEYWFWTPSDVAKFIQRDYPESVKTYDRYKLMISRADAMRYFVLHSYGGVYADLDTQCLKPFDSLAHDLPCVISEETHEHAHLLYRRNPANLMTTVMACRPTHPLYLLAIHGLPFTQKRYPNDVVKATGPLYFDTIYRHFIKTLPKTVATFIEVLPPEYFVPTYDVEQSVNFDRVCYELGADSPDFMKNTCKTWETKRKGHNGPSNVSYTTHYWVHVNIREAKWKDMPSVPIEDVLNTKTWDKTKTVHELDQDSYEDLKKKKVFAETKFPHNKKKGMVVFK